MKPNTKRTYWAGFRMQSLSRNGGIENHIKQEEKVEKSATSWRVAYFAHPGALHREVLDLRAHEARQSTTTPPDPHHLPGKLRCRWIPLREFLSDPEQRT